MTPSLTNSNNVLQLKPMTTPAMILAAGRGTRLKELTKETPKPLVPVAGTTPFERSADLLAKAGYTSIYANAWYCGEQIVKTAERLNQNASGYTVKAIVEDELLDTGGGIKNAMKHFNNGNPFIAVNGDLIWSEETHPILKHLPGLFDDSKMDALLLLMPRERAMGYFKAGDFFLDLEEGETTGKLRWREDAETAPYVYACIQILHPRLFEDMPEGPFSMTKIYRKASDAGRLYGVEYKGQWADMGTPEGMELAANMLKGLKSQVA